MSEQRKQHISVDGLEVSVTRKRIKRVYLRVHPDGQVVVSAPPRVPLSQIERFVSEHVDWVRRNRARVLELGRERGTARHDGGRIGRFGTPLLVRVAPDLPPGRHAIARPTPAGELLVLVPRDLPEGEARDAAVGDAVTSWQRSEVLATAPDLLARHEAEMGVRHTRLTVRRMRTRWGSCNVRTGRITLNSDLASLPPQCLESVVVHELCHLLEPSHNARFHALMDRYCPDWRDARVIMNRNPPGR